MNVLNLLTDASWRMIFKCAETLLDVVSREVDGGDGEWQVRGYNGGSPGDRARPGRGDASKSIQGK